MTDEIERARLEALPYKLNAYITTLLDGFKWAVREKNTSVVIVFDGRSGMGKTTLNNQCGKYCDPDFDLHKIHYSPESFLNGSEGKIGLAQAKQGDYICFDEAMLISSRAALSQINRMIIQAMSMIRSKKIIIAFCVNSIFDLDRNLALSRADILFHVYGDSLTDRGRVMTFFKGSDGRDRLKELYLRGKKYYDYGQPKSNFFCNFPSHFVVNEAKYEEEKQKGVNEFLQSTSYGRNNKASNLAFEMREKYILYLRENIHLTINEIAEIGGVSGRTIDNILAKLRKKNYEQL